MDIFNKIYLESFAYLPNNIIEAQSDVNGKKFKYIFNMNKVLCFPLVYKNTAIFLSAKNTDILHFINRFKNKKRNKINISLEKVQSLIFKAIDSYFSRKNTYNFNQSFRIHTKEFPDIIIPIQITKNNLYTADKMSLSEQYGNIFFNEYFCFVYTLLTADMISNNEYDKELIFEDIYVD